MLWAEEGPPPLRPVVNLAHHTSLRRPPEPLTTPHLARPILCVMLCRAVAQRDRNGGTTVGQGEMMAVAADRLLHDPNLRDVLDGMRSHIDESDPYTEQLIAAAYEASSLLDHGAGACGSAETPPWVRLGAMTALTKWGLGEETRVCSHDPHHMRPEPVFAAAFTPGSVTCRRCVGLLFEGADRHFCNGCGTRREQECYIGTLQIAALTWMFHLCAECHRELPDATMTCDGNHESPEPPE